jgi:hypothetical protein
MLFLLSALVAGCSGPLQAVDPAPKPASAAPPAPAATPAPAPTPAPEAAMKPLTLGGAFPGFEGTTRAGVPVIVPDPSGGVVILELIRSADW